LRCPAVALGVTALVGCATGRSAPFETTTSFGDVPRRAPGVVEQPVAAPASAVAQAVTSAGVLALRAPPDAALGRDLVDRFFAAVVSENLAALYRLLAEDARCVDGRRGATLPALQYWQARFSRLDYRLLADRVVFRPADVTTYHGGPALAVGAQRAGVGPNLPPEAVMVEVPVTSPRVGAVDLLADEMWFVLMPGPNGYRIAVVIENQRVP
jgi:hypothetical protein